MSMIQIIQDNKPQLKLNLPEFGCVTLVIQNGKIYKSETTESIVYKNK